MLRNAKRFIYVTVVLHNKKTMNKHITILLILLIPVLSFGQEQEYKSKEREKYYKNLNYKPFKPLSKKEISSFKNAHFDLEDIGDYTPYSDSLYLTPYQDSIYKIMFNPANRDSMIIPEPQFVGEIEKSQILKYEKSGEAEAFIYVSSKYENRYFGESGIWVAYSTNKGESWEYLYTGIVQQQPLYIKWYSKLPLINSKRELQIETCLLRQLSPFSHPGPGPTYEVVKDGLLLTLDLKTLRKDTDGDGLTDIVETKFYTNLNNKDTDGDGITDDLDLNPRLNVQRTDKTVIFESAVNEETNMFDTTGLVISSLKTPQINYATDTTETILIVTDNPDIQSIQPKSTRVIILSEKEYEKSKGLFRNELNDMSISPLFKVDNETDTYIFTRSFNTWGEEYLVKKTEKGWRIMIISSWIS